MDCYEVLKGFNSLESDGSCSGAIDTKTGTISFKCTQCYHYTDNREVNILGEVKKK